MVGLSGDGPRSADTAGVRGVLANALALGYACTAWSAGVVGVVAGGAWRPLGVLLLAHGLLIAAYLLHECLHRNLFAVRPGGADLHDRIGALLAWLTGACYASLSRLREKHLRHHFQRADVVAVDVAGLLSRRPRLARAVRLGEQLRLPAVDLLLHLLEPVHFWRQGGLARRRVVRVAAGRLAQFGALGLAGGLPALLGYGAAWLLFVWILHFEDAFQHRYRRVVALEGHGESAPRPDRAYEDLHTASNLLSRRCPPLNLLVLNFCYHNAHHRDPRVPWHQLPAFHRRIERELPPGAVLPLRAQLASYLRPPRAGGQAEDALTGPPRPAAGVSFLVGI